MKERSFIGFFASGGQGEVVRRVLNAHQAHIGSRKRSRLLMRHTGSGQLIEGGVDRQARVDAFEQGVDGRGSPQ